MKVETDPVEIKFNISRERIKLLNFLHYDEINLIHKCCGYEVSALQFALNILVFQLQMWTSF